MGGVGWPVKLPQTWFGWPRTPFEAAYYGLMWSPLAPLLVGIGVAWVVYTAKQVARGRRR